MDLTYGLTLEQYKRMEGDLKRPLTDDPIMSRADRARLAKPDPATYEPEEPEGMIELRRLLGLEVEA